MEAIRAKHQLTKCKKPRIIQIQPQSIRLPSNLVDSQPKKVESNFRDYCVRQFKSKQPTFIEDRIGRLPRNVIPIAYTLCIKPHLETNKFEGSVIIECRIEAQDRTDKLREIILNVWDLFVNKITWTDSDSEVRYLPKNYSVDDETQQMTIFFNPGLPSPSTGYLLMNFSGEINDSMTGFYKSYAAGRNEKFALVTKFGPCYARRCFPCWDEPEFKAKFNFNLIVPKNIMAISNTPVRIIIPHRTKQDLHIIDFQPTPPMSTFLLAWVIGEFEFLELKTSINPSKYVDIRAFVPIGQKDKAQLPLNLTQCFFQFYQTYLDVDYPLKKLDIIAVESHLTAGTGNWGLNILRSNRLLLENDNDEEELMKVMLIISREVARQWFGNLVTFDWWSHMWLSEGFTTFMEYLAIHDHEPEYEMWTHFVKDVTLSAMELDAYRESLALITPIHTSSEIQEANYNSMTYKKAGAIIRMLYHYVGPDIFQTGLQKIFNSFSYHNITTSDLFSVMKELSGKPIEDIFNTWTRQRGFPLVRITSIRHGYDQDPDTGLNRVYQIIYLSQELISTYTGFAAEKLNSSKFIWSIPIQIAHGSNPSEPFKEILMYKKQQQIKAPELEHSDWFQLNPGCLGFYRVKYPSEFIKHFAQAIRSRTFSTVDRLKFLNDFHVFAQYGISPTTELLSILQPFTDESEITVWKEIDKIIGNLDTLLQNCDFYPSFKNFVKYLYKNMYKKITWSVNDDETLEFKRFRIMILRRLIRVGYEKCIDAGYNNFRIWLKEGSVDNLENRECVFQSALIACSEDDEVFQILLRHFKDGSPEVKHDVIQSLSFVSKELLMTVLEFAISENVALEETTHLIGSIMENPVWRPIAWQFFKDHVDTLHYRFRNRPDLQPKLVHAVIKNFTTEKEIKEFVSLCQRHSFSGQDEPIKECLQKITGLVTWLRRDKVKIMDYLYTY